MTQQETSDFIRQLVTFGDLYRVDDKYNITRRDGVIKTTERRKKPLPLRIYHPDMMVGEDAVIFMPFTNRLREAEERMWMWAAHSTIIASLVSQIVEKLCSYGSSVAEDTPLPITRFLTSMVDLIDEKSWANFSKNLEPGDWVHMFYHAKTHTAQLQSRVIDDPDLRASIGKRMRKKDWNAAEAFIELIFGTTDLSLFQHTATAIDYLDAEARLTVLAKAAASLNDFTTLLLDVDLQPELLQQRVENLEEYHKAARWYASPEAKAAEKATTAKPQVKPWQIGTPITVAPSVVQKPAFRTVSQRNAEASRIPIRQIGGTGIGIPIRQEPVIAKFRGIPA